MNNENHATPEPVTAPEAGWYYSSVVQWIPEYSTEKINGYDGPFPTWQDALEALFKEVSKDADDDRARLAETQAENERLRGLISKALVVMEAPNTTYSSDMYEFYGTFHNDLVATTLSNHKTDTPNH